MSSTIIITIFGTIITVLLALLLIKLNTPKKKGEEDQTFLILQDQLERLRNTVENKLER